MLRTVKKVTTRSLSVPEPDDSDRLKDAEDDEVGSKRNTERIVDSAPDPVAAAAGDSSEKRPGGPDSEAEEAGDTTIRGAGADHETAVTVAREVLAECAGKDVDAGVVQPPKKKQKKIVLSHLLDDD